MPPAKSWNPSSEPPDPGLGTRDAPHGYRPWPNSGRDEPATSFRVRRTNLLDRIRSRAAVVGVVGLGYVGLPLARMFVDKGFKVLGFDTDPAKVKALAAGRSYIATVPPLKKKLFSATSQFGRLAETDAIVICVPTPLTSTGVPDLSAIRGTAEAVAKHFRSGQLVVLESTTYPGTTREEFLPRLEKTGRKFLLAYAPERQDPGNATPLSSIPRLVAGVDEPSRVAAAALYRAAGPKVIEVESLEVAEAAKLLENVYRSVNIALVNELKIAFERMGLDVWKVIDAAATKPFGFQAFRPGPGPGGHCIPIDPFYLAWKAERAGASAKFIRLAGELNTRMPVYVVDRIATAVKLRGARILLLGIAYKKDVGDPRESPAFAIAKELVKRGAKPSYHDPFFPKPPAMRHYKGLKLPPAKLTQESIASFDAVVVVTDHSTYDFDQIALHARVLIDTRHAVKDGPNVVRA